MCLMIKFHLLTHHNNEMEVEQKNGDEAEIAHMV